MHDKLNNVNRNLLVNMFTHKPFHKIDFFFRTLAEAATNHTKPLPYAPWIMMFLNDHTQIEFFCETKHKPFAPTIEKPAPQPKVSSKGKDIADEEPSKDGQERMPQDSDDPDFYTSAQAPS